VVGHVHGGEHAGDIGFVGVDGEFFFQVDDGIGEVVILKGQEGVVAPEVGLILVERASLVEEVAGRMPVFAALRLRGLTNEVGGGGIVFRYGRSGERGAGGFGGNELDEGFAFEAGVFEPLVIGLPLGGGDVLLEDSEFAVSSEDAVLELVRLVECGEGGLSVDGWREVGRPAFGEGHDGVVGRDVRNAELDRGDRRIFFVDVGEAYGGDLRNDAEVIPIAILIALVVVGELEGGDRVVGAGELGVGDFTGVAHGVGDTLRELIPLRGRDGADGLRDYDLLVAAEGHDDVGVGGARIVEGADGFEGVEEGKRRVFWSGFDLGIAGGGNDKGLLAADDGVEELEGRDFRSGVEPDGLAVDVGEGDGVVEGGGRRDGGIEGDAGADEDGVCVDAGGGEHGDQERGLVFAVAVLVAEDVAGVVRLEAADAKSYADVADLRANVGVDGAGLFVGRGFAGGEGGDLGADVVVGLSAGAFEGAVPGADLLPGVEVGPGDVGEGWVVVGAEGGIIVELEESVLFFAGGGRELGGLPVVDAFGCAVGGGGFVVGTPNLEVAVFGDVELDDF